MENNFRNSARQFERSFRERNSIRRVLAEKRPPESYLPSERERGI